MAAPRPLQGIGVIVTRPAHQAANMQRLLLRDGASVCLFPLLDIIELADAPLLCQPLLAEQWVDNQMNRRVSNHQADLIIFTSPNAVTFAAKHTDLSSLKGLNGMPNIAAVGAKTAECLTAAGLPADISPQHTFNSEALLAEPQLQSVSGLRISIIGGVDGRTLLQKTLEARGANVRKLALYQRQCTSASTEPLQRFCQQQSRLVIMLTSVDSLQCLLALTEFLNIPEHTVLLAGSERIAAALDKHPEHVLSCTTVLAANNPDDHSMLDRLSRWSANHD